MMIREKVVVAATALLALLWVSTVSASGSLEQVYTENFLSDEYFDDSQGVVPLGNSEEECAGLGCQSQHGWQEGKGYLTLSRIGKTGSEGGYNRMPAPYPAAPEEPSPPIKPSQMVAGIFGRSLGADEPANGQGGEDAITLIYDSSASSLCHLHYLRNKGSSSPSFSVAGSGLSHHGFEVGKRVRSEPSDPLWEEYIVGETGQGSDNGESVGSWDCSSDAAGSLEGDGLYGVVLVAGDFNGDKWQDVLYLRAADRNKAGTVDTGYVFLNQKQEATETTLPSFKRYKLTGASELIKAGISFHWSSPIAVATKFNRSNSEQDIRNCEDTGQVNDCRDDLIIASSSGSNHRVLLFKQKQNPVIEATTANLFEPAVPLNLSINMQPAATSISAATTGIGCGPDAGTTRGITALTAGDINNDGKTDIVIGGFNEKGLTYYYSNPDDEYNSTLISFEPGGVVGLFAEDWNYDGNLDLLITRTGEGCNGLVTDSNAPPPRNPAGVWVVYGNPDPDNPMRSEPERFRSGDLELLSTLGTKLHYSVPIQLDDDEDNYLDFIAGNNRSWGSVYYYFHSEWPGLYKTAGLAQSKRIDTWDPEKHLITEVTLDNISVDNYSPESGMQLTFMVTNNGVDWEELQPSELPSSVRPAGSGCEAEAARPHKFTSFGTDLRWGVVASVPRSPSLLREEQAIAEQVGGASKAVPKIQMIQLRSKVIEQAYYSRSALAYGAWNYDANGDAGTEYLYSASFRYPGFIGKLRAWDISDAPTTAVESGVNPGDNEHLSAYFQWDAGEKLRERPGEDRTFYYFTYEDGVAQRYPFAAGNPKLDELLDADGREPYLSLAEVSSLITYFKGPMGNETLPPGDNGETLSNWKLRDPGHSSPVFVGKPNADIYWTGSPDVAAYEVFAQQNANRTPMVYVGTNGGGLHAFNAQTGTEEWVMIPPNLVSKLPRQKDGNEYVHQYFVDGSIEVQDVYHNGSWHTVLIAGQAKGESGDGYNYYFAIDVTAPLNPIPLWEFTDKPQSTNSVCSGDTTKLEAQCPDASCSCGSLDSCLEACSGPSPIFSSKSVTGLEDSVVIEAASSDALDPRDWTTSPAGNPTTVSLKNSAVKCEIWPELNNQVSVAAVKESGCAHLQYNFEVPVAQDYRVSFLIRDSVSTHASHEGKPLFWYSIDEGEPYAQFLDQREGVVMRANGSGEWRWVTTNLNSALDSQGFLQLWVVQPLDIDTIVVHRYEEPVLDLNLSPPGALTPSCLNTCDSDQCSMESVAMTDPQTGHYTECSIDYEREENGDLRLDGDGKEIPIHSKCCAFAGVPADYLDGGNMCWELNQDCNEIEASTSLGETWSKPVLGRVNNSGQATWVAFFGSGYNNLKGGQKNVGRTVYAVDAYEGPATDGSPLEQWNFKEEPTSTRERVTQGGNEEVDGCVPAATEIEIDNALPGGPALVDLDAQPDGFVDRLYIGDLEGRLWKLVMDNSSGPNPSMSQWKHCVLFDAGDHDGDGVRNWAPIITKPAVAVIEKFGNGVANAGDGMPNVYFGTGADDRAPDDELYRFYSVQDDDPRGDCLSYNAGDSTTSLNIKHDDDLSFGSGTNGDYEWIVGDGYANDTMPKRPLDLPVDEGVTGERYWSDPVIVGNELIYFASLYGKIDQVDPEVNTAGAGGNSGPSKLYCYAIRDTGNSGLGPGESCWKDDQGNKKSWEEAYAKVRQGVTLRQTETATWARNQSTQRTEPTNIFFQRFSDADRQGPALGHEGTSASGNICIVHWREVPL